MIGLMRRNILGLKLNWVLAVVRLNHTIRCYWHCIGSPFYTVTPMCMMFRTNNLDMSMLDEININYWIEDATFRARNGVTSVRNKTNRKFSFLAIITHIKIVFIKCNMLSSIKGCY